MEVSHCWFHFDIFSSRKFAAANDKNHLNSTIAWIFYLSSYRFALYCTALALDNMNRKQSINQFSGPAYPWGVAGAAAQVGASKHLDPLQQRIDALLGRKGKTN